MRGTTAFTRPGYEAVTLVTRSGDRIRGVRKNEDEFSVQIMDMRERLQGYLKANLAEPIGLLRKWDLRWGVTSVPTSLAVFWGEDIRRRVTAAGVFR